MRRADIIVSIALLVFSGFYAILIYRLPSRDLPHTLGAAFVPWVLAGLLAILCLMLLASSIMSQEETSVVLPKRDLFGITALLLLIALYVKMMSYLGFIPVSIVFLAVLTWAAGSRKPLGIAIFAVTTTSVVYFLFQKFFGVQLPAGIFF